LIKKINEIGILRNKNFRKIPGIFFYFIFLKKFPEYSWNFYFEKFWQNIYSRFPIRMIIQILDFLIFFFIFTAFFLILFIFTVFFLIQFWNNLQFIDVCHTLLNFLLMNPDSPFLLTNFLTLWKKKHFFLIVSNSYLDFPLNWPVYFYHCILSFFQESPQSILYINFASFGLVTFSKMRWKDSHVLQTIYLDKTSKYFCSPNRFLWITPRMAHIL